MLKIPFLFTFLLLLSGVVMSQNRFIGYGFRAGISLGKYDGPLESGPNGETLEVNKMANGFHIGMTVNFKFGDLLGLRTELMFSQRGTDYRYNGPSYYVLGKNTLNFITVNGTRTQSIKVSNAYLDIPVGLYYKIKGFELFGGLNTGVLLSSTAGGTISFDGQSPLTGNPIAPFKVNLNYNYKKDKAGDASAATQNVIIDGRTYAVPGILGAYYDFPAKDKNYYKTLDFGLIGGLSYFLNQGLYLGVRYVYGLGDVDRNEYDISFQHLNPDGSLIYRNDKNKSTSWQFSVGFAF